MRGNFFMWLIVFVLLIVALYWAVESSRKTICQSGREYANRFECEQVDE